MPTHLLSRTCGPAKPAVRLAPDLSLVRARVHEACGPARRTLAMWLASQTKGPVMWIAPAWEAERLNPEGMLPWADPGRFLFVHPRRGEDLLWCMEEALRAGAVPLVVGDIPGLPGLTAVRRMHLAAETGAGLGTAPLGLLLTPGGGGAQGIESRWHMAATHEGHHQRWRLERRRARTAPPKAWTVTRTQGKGLGEGPGQDMSLAPG